MHSTLASSCRKFSVGPYVVNGRENTPNHMSGINVQNGMHTWVQCLRKDGQCLRTYDPSTRNKVAINLRK